jgi:YggT family protein
MFALVSGLRVLVFVLFAFAAVVALTHWAVTHAHLKPFGAFPRLVRQLGQPFVRWFERALLRRGGNPTQAPYAFFWVTVLGGLAVIALAQWLVGLIYSLSASAAAGPQGMLVFLVNAIFETLKIALFIRVISSWFSVSPYAWPMRVVFGLTNWLIEPLRKVIPPFGMIDVTPMVAYLMLWLAQGFLQGLLLR